MLKTGKQVSDRRMQYTKQIGEITNEMKVANQKGEFDKLPGFFNELNELNLRIEECDWFLGFSGAKE